MSIANVKQPADHIKQNIRNAQKPVEPSPNYRWTSRNSNQRTQCTATTSNNKPNLELLRRFSLVKKSLLDIARQFPGDCGFLSKEISTIATFLAPHIINIRNPPSSNKEAATQTTECPIPLFYEEISSIVSPSLELTVEQPGYKRARDQISNELYRDNLELNRENLRLAEQVMELSESKESLSRRYNDLSRMYEQLEKTLCQMHEATTAVSRGADIEKDDLLGEYIRPVFSPRSSNLSGRRCFSPRSHLCFDNSESTGKKSMVEHLRLTPAVKDASVQADFLETSRSSHCSSSNNLQKKLEVSMADCLVKASIIERIESAVAQMLDKQPGSIHFTLENVDRMMQIFSAKHERGQIQSQPRKQRNSARTTEDSVLDLAHCKSQGRLDPIPERSKKFVRKRE